MAERLLGPYRLVELKSSGPACDVWSAWDTHLNRRVEVRLVPRLARAAPSGEVLFKAFVDEVTRWSHLRHVAVQLPIDHAPLHSDEAWYVTEVVEGAIPLRRLLDTSGRLAWTQAAMVLHELAATLSLVHQRGLVHGHLRPAAVLLQLRGRVLLAEMGVALQVMVRTGVAAFEGIGSVADQRIYLSPEALALKDQDVRSDLFSLGILAFEMLTGHLPFASEADVRGLGRPGAVVPDPGQIVGHLPAGLRTLVQDLLAPLPASRPESAAVVLEQLRYLLARDGIADVRESLRDGFRRQAHLFSDDPQALAAQRAAERPLLDDTPEPQRPPGERAPVKRSTAQLGAPLGGRSSGTRKQLETSALGAGAKTLSGPPRAAAPPATDPTPPAPRAVRRTTESMVAPAPKPNPLHDILPRGTPGGPDRSSTERTAWIFAGVLTLGLAGAVWALVGGDPVTAPTAPPVERTALVDREPGGHERIEGERDEPMAAVAEARPSDPVEIVREKARAAMKLGNWPGAEAHAREGLDLARGTDAELSWLLAEALERLGRVDEARDAYLRVDALSLRDTRGHEAAGRLLVEAGRHDEAFTVLKEAFDRGAESAALFLWLAECHLARGEADEAEAALGRATALGAEDPQTLLALAKLLERRGDHSGARRHYQAALDRDPALEAARVGLARLSTAAGRPREALALLEGGEHGDEEMARLVKAEAAFQAGRFAEAAELFGEAARAEGATAAVLRNFAVALERAGRAGAPSGASEAAEAAAPGAGARRYFRGRLLAGGGRGEEARRALARAVDLDRRRWEPAFELGLAATADGDWRAAATAFAETLSRSPDHPAALQNLGRAQVELGRAGDAVETFRTLARVTPADPAPMLTAAALLQRMGRETEMTAALAEACRRGATEACSGP